MPEGDSIRRLAVRIRERYAGWLVTDSTFRHPRLATLDLSGRRLVDTASHGKHLFVRFDDGTSMHVHLLMQGRVRFGSVAGAETWRRRFELELSSDDGRRGRLTGVDVPLLHHIATEHETRFTEHLGPDVCGDFDVDVAVDRLRALCDAPLGAAMLDQRAVAGWGNIYAVETPFLCGLSPFCPVGSVDGLRAVVDIGAQLIRTNAERGPQNTTGRRLDTSDHWILSGGRTECRVCRSPLERFTDAVVPWRRRTVRCPTCQPDDGTRADVTRARRLLALHPASRRIPWDELAAAGSESGLVTEA